MSRVALVVDDDPTVLELIAEMLEELGCEVITRQDAAEALTALEQDQRIEILLTDINMPGIAGYELAKRARRLRPRVKPILVSGREIDSHGFPLLRKPFMQRDLVETHERNDRSLLMAGSRWQDYSRSREKLFAAKISQ